MESIPSKVPNMKFKRIWLNTYPWINSVPVNPYQAYCKLCRTIISIIGGQKILIEHEKNHQRKLQLTILYESSLLMIRVFSVAETESRGATTTKGESDFTSEESISEEDFNTRKSKFYNEVYGSDTTSEGDIRELHL